MPYSNLEILNSLIHFTKRGPFRTIGYNIALVEIKLGNKNNIVVADFVTHSQRLNYTQICEIKTGNSSFDTEQAKTYSSLDKGTIYNYLYFIPPKDRAGHNFDISYVCHDTNDTFICNELKKIVVKFPVIRFEYDTATDKHKVLLISGSFSEKNIDNLLRRGIEFNLGEIHEYIKFDKESDNGSILRIIIPNLLKFAHKRMKFTVELILQDIFKPWWGTMHAEKKNELRARLRASLQGCVQSGMVDNVLIEPARENGLWEFRDITGKDLMQLQKKLENVATFLEGERKIQGKLY